MKKLVIFAVLIMSVSVANAGFFAKLKQSQQPQPGITLPPPEPLPPTTQEVTVESVYVQAIDNNQEGGNQEQKESNVGAVPVPAALPLMASALCIFGIARRRSINK
ncbi:MAG: hypothetical protein ACXW1T_00420 [Methylophilus sp.]